MNIRFKFLTQDDASLFKDVRLKSYKEAALAFSESYEDEKDKGEDEFAKELEIYGNPPEWFVLGAFDPENNLIGFAKFRRDRRSKARHKSMIHAMYVHPAYRQLGVGGQLIKELFKHLDKLEGLEQIHLWVLHADTSASGFYEKYGFLSQGIRVKNDIKIGDVYVDAEYMVKYLVTY